ncbi:MAG: DUF2927 domain-containing protein [Sphingomonadales bacterium]|nr:DUF2927 domain-containing protein [Sphingomonadales bacterium]
MPRIRAAGLRLAAGLSLIAALAACEPSPYAPTPQAPKTGPRPVAAPPGLGTAPRSPESQAMQAYYAQVQDTLAGRGLLRQDVAPRDVPFSKRQLVDDFIHIALYDEYTNRGGTFVARQTPSRLRRWAVPVQVSVEFGDSVPQAERKRDRALISAYAGQLARATRHPVGMAASPAQANFNVLVLNEDERRAIGPRLRELVPGVDQASLEAIINLQPTTFCVVFAFSEGAVPSYSRAVAVIRGEHPETLRRSCVHEELAQGLGLANDYPRARPSIFNDDEEFALLTRHDELLLQILYDPRLRPGMTEAEARPIVEAIATEIMGPDA